MKKRKWVHVPALPSCRQACVYGAVVMGMLGTCLMGCASPAKEMPSFQTLLSSGSADASVYDWMYAAAASTAEAYDNAFLIKDTVEYPGTAVDGYVWFYQKDDVLLEVTYMKSQSADPSSLQLLRIKDGKQKNINLDTFSGNWAVGAVFDREPIYTDPGTAGIQCLLSHLCKGGSEIMKEFSKEYQYKIEQTTHSTTIDISVEDPMEVAKQVAHSRFSKAGFTWEAGSSEIVVCNPEGVIEQTAWEDEAGGVKNQILTAWQDADAVADWMSLFDTDLQEGEIVDASLLHLPV